MSTSSSTHSRLLDKRKAVPLLLSSFPAPPTFIPTNISGSPHFQNLAHSNPPPSLPPSSPLPPVPGPSPISEHDTLMFISAARSRRSSRLSVNSSRRESTATIASIVSKSGSNCSVPPLSPSSSLTPIDPSNRSIRSFPSTGSLSHSTRASERHSRKEPQIREEEPSELTELTLDDLKAHSPLPETDLSDDEKVLEIGILPPSLKRIRSPPALKPIPASPPSILHLSPQSEEQFIITPTYAIQSPSPLHRSFSKSKLNKELPPLPPTAGSSSASSKRSSAASRPDSPDIQSILASTPRPRRKSASSLHSSSRSHSTSRSLRRSSTRTGLKQRRREDPPSTMSLNLSTSALESRKAGAHSWSAGDSSKREASSELPYVRRASNPQDEGSYISDYGVYVDGTGTEIDVIDNEEVNRLERELEGAGSDSDSSIDLHTPLPHVMLRDGLLSPHSKLLPESSRASSPLRGRPGSMLSVASTSASIMTKSGLYKDQRDTQRRRIRHRDGRLLKEGVGLTTGLGWSDSEDEDAPSPLTRRISSVLARKHSEGALQSQSISRSTSATAISAGMSTNRQGERPRTRSSLPPTSWARRTEIRASTSSSSTASSALGRSARVSGHSEISSPLAGWRGSENSISRSPLTNQSLEPPDAFQETCSTSSTSSGSLLLPITPVGSEDPIQGSGSYGAPEAKAQDGMSRLRRMPSAITDSSLPSRNRTQSGSSVASSLAASTGSHTPCKTPVPSMPARTPVPRPLRLPQVSNRPQAQGTPFPQMTTGNSNSISSGRDSRSRSVAPGKYVPPVPTPSRLARPTAKSLSSRSATLVPPVPKVVPVADKPKPRTGTGMQYRSGSVTPGRPTLLRAPSSGILRMSANGSVQRDVRT